MLPLFHFTPWLLEKKDNPGFYMPKHYTPADFACHCGCGFDAADADLIEKLDDLTDLWGKKLAITSGCRCEAHNKKVGGVSASPHLSGRAVDFLVSDARTRYTILQLALHQSFSGIGIGKTFMHLDVKEGEGRPGAWVYG